MTISATSIINVVAAAAGSLDLGSVQTNERFSHTVNWTDGTGVNQGKQIFSDTRSLDASTSEDLDLAGSLTDGLGASVAFTSVKLIAISAPSTNGDVITVGGAASNQFATPFGDASDVINLRPGGAVVLVAPDATGYAVTAGTGDLLKIANTDDAAASYSILIIGETA